MQFRRIGRLPVRGGQQALVPRVQEGLTVSRTTTESPPAPMVTPALDSAVKLERRGRWWLIGSFLLCPCHLPFSLAVLATLLAGTSVGVVLRDHTWLAAGLISAVWAAGTGYGLMLVRRAERNNGACPIPSAS